MDANEVEREEERIRSHLEERGMVRGAEGFEDLVCLIFGRNLLVRKLRTVADGSRVAREVRAEIIDHDVILARHGLC